MKPTHLAQAIQTHKQNNENELIKAAVDEKQLGAEVAAESLHVGAGLVYAGFGTAYSLCSVSSSFVPVCWKFGCVDCFIFTYAVLITAGSHSPPSHYM